MDKKQIIKLTESDLHRVIKKSLQKILKEDFSARYDELIKDEMHRLYELERRVPNCYKTDIHSCVTTMESILSDINMRNDIARI